MQLNILCKNIAGVLQSLSSLTAVSGDAESLDEEGREASMCRVGAIGSICIVASRWAVVSGGLGKDASFLLLSMRVLYAFVHSPPPGSQAGVWCRWTAAHGLAEVLKGKEMWMMLSKKSQVDTLR